MNHPKKLTPAQEEFVSTHNLNPDDYCFLEETEFHFIVVNKASGQKKWLDKFGKEKTVCGNNQ